MPPYTRDQMIFFFFYKKTKTKQKKPFKWRILQKCHDGKATQVEGRHAAMYHLAEKQKARTYPLIYKKVSQKTECCLPV